MNKITHPRILALVPTHQQSTLRGMESNDFNEVIQTITKLVEALPDYCAEGYDPDTNETAYLHYFYGGCDWFIMNWDSDNQEFYGYAILNSDIEMSEYGYISVDELISDGRIELDFYWTPVTVEEAVNEKYPGKF
jgi:hypothetical protein